MIKSGQGVASPFARDAGFVLLPVLLVTGLTAVIAMMLTLMSRDDIAEMRLARDLALARLNADNALVRAIAALGDPADPLHPLLLRVDEVTLIESGGIIIEVMVEHEHGKVDLNVAHPDLLRLMLKATIPETADSVNERIQSRRATGQWIEGLDILFEPATPFLPVADLLRRRFTVLTGAEGLVPELVSRETWRALSNHGLPASSNNGGNAANPVMANLPAAMAAAVSLSRPIYTIRARVQPAILPPLVRRVMIAYRQLPIKRSDDIMIASWD